MVFEFEVILSTECDISWLFVSWIITFLFMIDSLFLYFSGNSTHEDALISVFFYISNKTLKIRFKTKPDPSNCSSSIFCENEV